MDFLPCIKYRPGRLLPSISDRADFQKLHDTLQQLAAQDPVAMARLFAPAGERGPVALRDGRIRAALLESGLAFETRSGLCSPRRIRQHGERFYLMEVGDVVEYFQDLWPETDAMLAALADSRPGTLLDLGTGCGIVAIEAAARGHRVVATDLYETTLALARFNAALNGFAAAIDFRQGHLFEPVSEERFELILTAPHYTRVNDQLRLEVLLSASPRIAPGGSLVVATFLEWPAERPPPVIAVALQPLQRRGFSITVAPLLSPLKRDWFTRATAEAPWSGPPPLSRARFLITITAPLAEGAAGRLELTLPPNDAVPAQHHVPLARLRHRLAPHPTSAAAPLAVVATEEDVAALEQLLVQLREGLISVTAPLGGLLDACRFGFEPCVSATDTSGAAGAILDQSGGVRPCTAGSPAARAHDSAAAVLATWRALSEEASERRGCLACAARSQCSRCLYPAPLSERAYCDFVRAQVDALPLLRDFLKVLRALPPGPWLPLRFKLRRHPTLLCAGGRPFVTQAAPHALDALVGSLRQRWTEWSAWLAQGASRHLLILWSDGRPLLAELDRATAQIAELLADGSDGTELGAYCRSRLLPPGTEDRALGRLAQLLF